MEESDRPSKRPKAAENPKTIWLLTYASSSPDISHEILKEFCIQCTEIYTITWRESKYSLLRLCNSNRKRHTFMKNTMLQMNASHGIRGSEIVGYSMISSNSEEEDAIQDHPAFKRVVHLINTKIEDVRMWMEKGTVHTNETGLLWNLIEMGDPTTMTRHQLVIRVQSWTPLIKEYESLKPSHDALMTAYTTQGRELAKTREDLKKESIQCETFFKQLCEKIDECGELKKRLVQLGHKLSP